LGTNVEPLVDLMVRRAALLEELQSVAVSLKARGLGRTDQIVGELGERLALAVYGGTLETVSAKNIDLVDGTGRRIQVKARELPAGVRRPYRFASAEFDVALVIRFNRKTFAIEWARELARDEFSAIASPYGSGWQVSSVQAAQSGQDVTSRFRKAWLELTQEPMPQQ
jgi:hypothetical protein